jgi:hypothetical protein
MANYFTGAKFVGQITLPAATPNRPEKNKEQEQRGV